jgi:recombination protein RecR
VDLNFQVFNMKNISCKALDDLTEKLHQLPGIGEKTAFRLALYILKTPPEYSQSLAETIIKVKHDLHFCKECYNITEQELCNICDDSQRDHATICVVEDIIDIIAIENSNEYRGTYHVLGGVISPLAGISPDNLNIKKLTERVKNETIHEILLALNPSTEGETTMIYLSKLLKGYGKKVTRIASGIPLGAHLEFIDYATIGRAIMTRREV